MRDGKGLPHDRLRIAIFWVLFAAWPVLFLVFDLLPDSRAATGWFEDFGTGLAVCYCLVVLMGKADYQDTQRRLYRQYAEDHRLLTQIVSALDAMGAMPARALKLVHSRSPRDDGGDQDAGTTG